MSNNSSLSLGAEIWERTGRDEISRNTFNLVYGACTILGLVVTAYLSTFSSDWVMSEIGTDNKPHMTGTAWALFGTVLVTSIIGTIIATKSANPIVSLFGYMIVATGFGLLLGPVVAQYTATSVTKVMFITGSLVLVLTVMGVVIPESLQGWSGYLFCGLALLLVGQFAIPVAAYLIPGFPLKEVLTVTDWIGVVLFSGYVIYDVNRAQRVAATYDNAVDCALALYLDIINLFIRLLRLMGEKKK